MPALKQRLAIVLESQMTCTPLPAACGWWDTPWSKSPGMQRRFLLPFQFFIGRLVLAGRQVHTCRGWGLGLEHKLPMLMIFVESAPSLQVNFRVTPLILACHLADMCPKGSGARTYRWSNIYRWSNYFCWRKTTARACPT